MLYTSFGHAVLYFSPNVQASRVLCVAVCWFWLVPS